MGEVDGMQGRGQITQNEAAAYMAWLRPIYERGTEGLREGLGGILSRTAISGESSGGVYGELRDVFDTSGTSGLLDYIGRQLHP